MSREIKFTSFGIPYVLEFENVSVVPHTSDHRPPSPSSSSSSFCYIDSPPSRPRNLPPLSFLSPSSIFKRKSGDRKTVHSPAPECHKPLPPPPASDASDAQGICIQFPPGSSCDHISRKERLVRLQQTISVAVLDAGMSRSPGNASNRPGNHSNGHAVHSSRGYRTTDALFCGTYGQLMAALEGAGLSAIPCAGESLPGHVRLGALFVARNDGASGVQLRKITLWG